MTSMGTNDRMLFTVKFSKSLIEDTVSILEVGNLLSDWIFLFRELARETKPLPPPNGLRTNKNHTKTTTEGGKRYLKCVEHLYFLYFANLFQYLAEIFNVNIIMHSS